MASEHGSLDDLTNDQLIDQILERDNLPAHIAIIMDGNGRWAQRRCLPRVAGHRAGRHSVRRSVRICRRLGISALTLYTFSRENFNRPRSEVEALWSFLSETLVCERDELAENNVQLRASGELKYLPEPVQQVLSETIEMLAGNDGLVLNLALAYGGRQEILRAAAALAGRVQAGELEIEEFSEAEFRKGLYCPELPDPDLVIRTSGEFRLSNFLPWQTAYSEILITPILWPAFRKRDLLLAICDYQGRQRRFGGLVLPEQNREPLDEKSLLDPVRWQRLLKERL